MSRAWAVIGAAVVAMAAVLAVVAPSASAVVVKTAGGQLAGVTPHHGISPARVPGAVAAGNAARPLSSPSAGSSTGGSTGTLVRGTGPVAHSSDPYLIFWDPNGSIPAAWQQLLEQYFTDVAAASGQGTDVYAVARQYYDGSGFADYRQSFSTASQMILDTQPYPTADSDCSRSPYLPNCLSDQQLQDEVSRLIAADHLPTDGPSGGASLASSAPIYFVVLPTTVDVCFSDGSNTCANNYFCAYHSNYVDSGNNVLYAAIPLLPLDSPEDAKGCQADSNPNYVQEPNGSLADVALKYMSHEDNEAITDPIVNTGWVTSSAPFNEVGDNCNQYGSFDPLNGTNPNAFLPTLGGSPTAGTLYNQLINGDRYYLQSEWSNGDDNCEMQPSSGTITSRFAVPGSPRALNTSLTFDPTASSSTNGYTSESWDFGDGTSAFHSGSSLTSATHSYSSAGVKTVKLTLVDNRGNLATVSRQITIGSQQPVAAFTSSSSPSPPNEYTPITFTSTSTDSSGGTISSYAWDFGDGTAASTAATPHHTFAAPGTYLVTLSVTDSLGATDTTTHTVTVADESPTASFTTAIANPTAGQSIRFDGTASNDPDGSIVSYSWAFADGGTASGATPTHTYTTAGTYNVTLTVTDSSGQRTSWGNSVVVVNGPIAAFTVSPSPPHEGSPITFDGSASNDPEPGVSIRFYSWSFDQGSTWTTPSSSPTTTYTYATPGTYTVELKVTNSNGVSDTDPGSVTVTDEPPTAGFAVGTPVAVVGQPVAFDAGRPASSDPDGSIVLYRWDFGDQSGTFNGATPTHTYASAGTYTVTLTVTDSDSQSSTATQQIVVHTPPSATFTSSPTQPREHTPVTFTPTTSTEPGAPITSYAWSFGDGATSTAPNPSHPYGAPGTYTVELTVTNSLGLSATTSQQLGIADEPAHAAIAVKTARPASRQPVAFDGSSSSDPDGSIVSYRWSLGDGTSASGAKPAHVYRKPGTYTVTLTVTGSGGETATATTQLAVALAGRITKLSISNTAAGTKLVVTVNTLGVIAVGRKTVRVKKAGTVKIAIQLTSGQKATVARAGRLKLRIKLRFVPVTGPASTQMVTLAFTPRAGSSRFNAVLKQ